MLIKCPECGREVSDKAAACPQCGCPVAVVSAPHAAKKEPVRTSASVSSALPLERDTSSPSAWPSFAIESGGPKRLAYYHGSNYERFTLELDSTPVLVITTRIGLEAGREVQTDAGLLRVHLTGNRFFGDKLLISLNGRAVPGSDGDPIERLKMASTAVFVIGGLVLLASAVGLVQPDWALVGWWGIPVGVAYVVLGWQVRQRHSMMALSLAFGLYLVDGLYGVESLLHSQSSGGSAAKSGFALGAVVVRVALLVPMFGGLSALREMRADRRRAEST
jgi:hypothetical protein